MVQEGGHKEEKAGHRWWMLQGGGAQYKPGLRAGEAELCRAESLYKF